MPGLFLLVVIAAVCGAIGRAIAGGVRGGLIVPTALGFIGAALFVALLHLFYRRR